MLRFLDCLSQICAVCDGHIACILHSHLAQSRCGPHNICHTCPTYQCSITNTTQKGAVSQKLADTAKAGLLWNVHWCVWFYCICVFPLGCTNYCYHMNHMHKEQRKTSIWRAGSVAQQAHLLNPKVCESGFIAAPLYARLGVPGREPVSNKDNLFVTKQREMFTADKFPG